MRLNLPAGRQTERRCGTWKVRTMDKHRAQAISNGRAHILIEALPYIRQWAGKTVVVKYGGAAMTDPALKRSVTKDLVLLHYVGVRVVIVHGGGPRISEMMQRLGAEPAFVGGLRVTDERTMEIVQMVMVGLVGQELVSLLNSEGGRAVGLSGKDANVVTACKLESPHGELGFVGEVAAIDTRLIDTLNEAGYIVVLTPVGSGGPGCDSYNINADTVACAVAEELNAEKLIILSDVPGLLRDVEDPQSVISQVTTSELAGLIADGTIGGGMIPKAEAGISAIANGVHSVHMVDGRAEHSLLVELFTEEGIGTMITAGSESGAGGAGND